MRIFDFETIAVDPNPIAAIMWVITGLGFIGSIYLLSPVFSLGIAVTGAPVVVQSLVSTLGLAAVGVSSLIANGLGIYGLIKHDKKLQAKSMFALFIIRLYVVFALILIQGLFPLSWLANFTVMLVCGICYLYLKYRITEEGAP